jgi:serine-type D-Ala-D-Ala carboxypeptidase/endopeptidase
MSINFSSDKLITQRKLQGLSQDKLAEKAGISIRTLQRIEKNEVKPQPYTLGCLATALGIQIEDLTASIQALEATEISPRQLSMLHFAALSGCFVPLGNILAPLFLWIYSKQTSKEWIVQAKEVLNFQISWVLYLFIVLGLYFTIEQLPFLVFLIPIMMFLNIIIFPVYSGFRIINNKESFYPLSIQFFKIQK